MIINAIYYLAWKAGESHSEAIRVRFEIEAFIRIFLKYLFCLLRCLLIIGGVEREEHIHLFRHAAK